MQVSDIRLYNLLKNKYGDQGAEEFVSLLKEQMNENFESKKEILVTKNDIADVQIKITQLETKLAQTETKIILWAFVFWATQLGAVFTFIKYFIK